MPEYVLDHHREGERDRLDLMSRLLDPMHRRHIERLGVGPGARTLEVGCGNGSISAWLAERVAPGGRAIAVDLDLSLVDADLPNLELRQADIVAAPVEPRDFDLVTARAVLHHVADARAAVANLVASVRPGGAILLIEPDFLPVSVAEPPDVRAFWDGWLAWSRRAGIDYLIGRSLPGGAGRPGHAGHRMRPPRPRSTTAARRGPSTGSRRWSSCAAGSSPPATSTTGRSTRSSPTAPIRPGGRRRSRSPPSPPARPAADPSRLHVGRRTRHDARHGAHLRHGPPQPRHRLDRVRGRLRGAQGPARSAQRVRPGPARRAERPDALGARAQRRAASRSCSATSCCARATSCASASRAPPTATPCARSA